MRLGGAVGKQVKKLQRPFPIGRNREIFFCLFTVNHSSAKDFPICPSLELCPSGWLYFQRKCYYLSESEDNWNSSQSFCALHNASLLVIENHQELVREQKRGLVSAHLASKGAAQ